MILLEHILWNIFIPDALQCVNNWHIYFYDIVISHQLKPRKISHWISCSADGLTCSIFISVFVVDDLFRISVAVTVQGTRKTSTSPWLFDDGTAMNYFNWKVNEPSNDIIEFYIYLNPAVNWQWNDIDKKGKSFLCELRVWKTLSI